MNGGNTRRGFLKIAAAAAASGALPTLGWADAGAPAYLAAAKTPSGDFFLCGLGADGGARFRLPLPGRGHAAAAHPSRPLAVAFARRPGAFALVIDCALGVEIARLTAPEGRHFYGHGAFDAEGARLYTCENAYDEDGEGRIGVWNAADGFKRIGEFASGGIGPHELVYDRDRRRIVAANGGIQTHPDSGRAKLNLPVMRPNLAYLDPETGAQLAVIEPPEELRMNSLRHLALRAEDGLIAVAAQWQGDPYEAPPLLALHRFGAAGLRFHGEPEAAQIGMKGYGGSVAFSADGAAVGIPSPRGARLQIFAAETGAVIGALSIEDVCGLAPGEAEGFLASDGLGRLAEVTLPAEGPCARTLRREDGAWDNHIVPLRRVV